VEDGKLATYGLMGRSGYEQYQEEMGQLDPGDPKYVLDS
jgi:hypothetical protein